MTWSVESAFVSVYSAAAVVVAGVLDKFATVEEMTRPERQQWGDVDTEHDGAEQLAEREAEEPRLVCACCFERERTQGSCLCGYCTERGVDQGYYSRHELIDDTANPNEPGLDNNELVAVRQLIEDRFPLFTVGDLTTSPAASAAGDDPAGIPDATWLEPAICTILDGHEVVKDVREGPVHCFESLTGITCGVFDDWQDWCEHVAPKIATHLEYALRDYPAITPQTDVIGCVYCDHRPFIIKHPDGSTRFVCQYHGLVAVEDPHK